MTSDRYATRVAAADWAAVGEELDAVGCALLPPLLTPAECRRVATGAPGWSAAPVRHGVSVVRSGRRHTLGLVFHDAA